MVENVITHLLVVMGVSLSFAYLQKKASKPVPKDEEGKYLLRMPRLYQVVSVAGMLLGLLFLLSPLFVENPDLTYYLIIAFVFIFSFGLGVICWLYYERHFVQFDADKIKTRSVYGKDSSIAWSNIVNARFNSFTGLLSLTDRYGSKLAVHYQLIGFATFVQYLEQKTSFRATELRLPVGFAYSKQKVVIQKRYQSEWRAIQKAEYDIIAGLLTLANRSFPVPAEVRELNDGGMGSLQFSEMTEVNLRRSLMWNTSTQAMLRF